MVVFASPQWVHELDVAARRLAVPRPDGEPRSALRVTYALDDAPPGTGSYVIELTDRGVSAMPAPAGPPPPGMTQVTLTQPYDLACALAEGREAAAPAVLDGRIRVSGTVTSLVAWQAEMRDLDSAIEVLRDRTTRPPDPTG